MKKTRPDRAGSMEALWLRTLGHPKLPIWLVVVALVLTSPSLFIGFYLDDFIGRYIYSDLEGAERLFRIYSGGYGTANGNPIDAHWQVEQGFAPWWIYPKLLLALYRPVSLWTHLADPWPNGAAIMHAHSLLWFALLVLLVVRLFRGFHGPLIGGLAAALYALDHTHGFAVGLITNRHTLIGTAFGVLALDEFLRSRRQPHSRSALLFGLVAYVIALFSTEASIAVAGYVFSYVLCVERESLRRRLLALLPFVAVTLAWRALYVGLGYGAKGSGLYVDPGREPLSFLGLLVERIPILVMGQFAAPPAEVYTFLPSFGRAVLWVVGILVIVGVGAAMLPLLRVRPSARFWALGMALSFIPASTSHPSNRLLFFSGLGAMGLIAELWHLHAVEWREKTVIGLEKLSRGFGALLLFGHLLVSPLVLPLSTCSVMLSSPIKRAFDDVGSEAEGRTAVFVSAPDYYSVRLMRMNKEVDGQPTPKYWRVLSYGSQALSVRRTDARTLLVDYDGGILGTEPMQLYRDATIPMSVSDRVELRGLNIEVLAVTDDHRAKRVRFEFSEDLGSDDYRFYFWSPRNRFERFVVPGPGQERSVPGAIVELGLP